MSRLAIAIGFCFVYRQQMRGIISTEKVKALSDAAMYDNIMQIRPAITDDLEGVLPLVAKTCAFHEAEDPVKYPFLPEPEKRYRGWLSRCVNDPDAVFLVADDNGTIAGFLVATVEDEIPIYRVKRYAFVQDIWVEPSYRRHGAARGLLQEAIERFRDKGVEQFRLDVLTDNAPARKLFESCGFRTSVMEMILPLER